jgi:hypothetical protein
MSPYAIATKVRKVSKQLDDFAYYSFDRLEPEMRVSIQSMLKTLSLLADEIEDEADAEFEQVEP